MNGSNVSGRRPADGREPPGRIARVFLWVFIASLVVGAVLVTPKHSLVPIAGLIVTLIGVVLEALRQAHKSDGTGHSDVTAKLWCLLLIKLVIGIAWLAAVVSPELRDDIGLVVATLLTSVAMFKLLSTRR